MPRSPAFHLSLGTLLSTSLGSYFRNFLPFTLLSLLLLSPWIALRWYIAMRLDAMQESPDRDAALGTSMLQIAAFLLQTLLTYILTGALCFGVVQQLRGQRAGLATVLTQGLQTFTRVLGTGLLCGVRILLFSLLLWVPGIIESIKLYVAIPAAVMEGKSGGQAVARSMALTDGSRWQIFSSVLLMGIVSAGLGALIVFIMLSGNGADVSDSLWFEVAIALVVNSISATMMSVCYFMLRQGKENVDAKQIAAVFD